MAATLPDKLKKADLQRFAVRAAQLEKARPIVTYWCEYYLLQQVLGRQLHVGDDETSNYAVQLMDKLETTKAASASNDAIVDDVAAKAYMENFALETFNRADESQRANKVTKQTADTFMAAATFLDTLSIWGELDREIGSKSKYAKYHARRILQAFKAGEDPNQTNPVVEPPPAPVDDELDAELKSLESEQNGVAGSSYVSPAVEDEEGSIPHVMDPETAVDVPPSAAQANEYTVSPLEPAEAAASRQNSIGGGYFPNTPSAPADVEMDDSLLPSAPPDMDPQDYYNTAAPAPETQPSAPTPTELGITSPSRPSAPTPNQMTAQPPAVPPVHSPTQQHIAAQQPPVPARAPVIPLPVPAPQPAAPPPTTGFRTDDESTMAAQKHARWAISALNFEDVNTAVKELRLALQSLGAT